MRERRNVGEHVLRQARDQEQDEHDDVELLGSFPFAELAHVLLGHHGLHEGGTQLVHEHKDERAGDDAAEPDDERAHPGAVDHAGGHLHHFAGNEGHHDLEELDSQQNEEAPGAGVANVGGDAIHPAGLEQLVDHGPESRAHHDHDDEEHDEARELEDVRCRHLMAGNGLLLVGLGLQLLEALGFGGFVIVCIHGLQCNGAPRGAGHSSESLYLGDGIVSNCVTSAAVRGGMRP